MRAEARALRTWHAGYTQNKHVHSNATYTGRLLFSQPRPTPHPTRLGSMTQDTDPTHARALSCHYTVVALSALLAAHESPGCVWRLAPAAPQAERCLRARVHVDSTTLAGGSASAAGAPAR
jgi:hypothetical protein